MFVLIRHPAIMLPPGICYGRLDAPVARPDEVGAIVGRLAALPAFSLWSSPAPRCLFVARAVGQARGVPAGVDDRLLELHFGDWEGRPWSEAPRADLDRWAAGPSRFAPPGGESGASLIARVAAFHEEIRDRPGPHVVVSHGGPLRVLTALIAGRPIDLLAPSPELGSVRFIADSGSRAGDAQDDAFGDDLRGPERVAGMAADVPPGQD